MGDAEPREALVAISAVAAVVWSGGLIGMQLKRVEVPLFSTLEISATAFLLPLVALVPLGGELQLFASIIAARYVYSGTVTIHGVMKHESPKIETKREEHERKRINLQYYQAGAFQLGLAVLYVVFDLVPTLDMAAKLSVIALVISLRRLIDVLKFELNRA